MRLDRLITLGMVSPVREVFQRLPVGKSRAAPVPPSLPILMYHSISDAAEPGFSPYYKVCTSPQRFADQMKWLAEKGWRGVTLSEGLQLLRQPSLAGGRPVAITFDDGFRDFHTAAFPALQKYGFSATVYVPTGFIDEERKSFISRECLTWSEVRQLHRAGIEFGSHTVNHPQLVGEPWPKVERELIDSYLALEQRLGEPVRSFAYPYAFPQASTDFVRRFNQLLQQAGYESCVTTMVGRARPGDDRLQLPRLPVNSEDDRPLLDAKLRGTYDWIALAQRTFKMLKRLRSGQQIPQS